MLGVPRLQHGPPRTEAQNGPGIARPEIFGHDADIICAHVPEGTAGTVGIELEGRDIQSRQVVVASFVTIFRGCQSNSPGKLRPCGQFFPRVARLGLIS